MDQSFRQQGADTQQPGGLLAASLKFFNDILNWLTGLFELTEEEQKEAGIQPRNQHYE